MAGATWNCCYLGSFCVHHTTMSSAIAGVSRFGRAVSRRKAGMHRPAWVRYPSSTLRSLTEIWGSWTLIVTYSGDMSLDIKQVSRPNNNKQTKKSMYCMWNEILGPSFVSKPNFRIFSRLSRKGVCVSAASVQGIIIIINWGGGGGGGRRTEVTVRGYV